MFANGSSRNLELGAERQLNDFYDKIRDKEAELEAITVKHIQNKAKISRTAEIELANLEKKNIETRIDIELQRIDRITRAEKQARNELDDTRLDVEKKITELTIARAKIEKESFNAYAMGERLTKQYADRLAIQKQINAELIKYDVTLESKRGQRISNRLKSEAAIKSTEERAKSYVNNIPLVGKKFGERGYISDIFKDLSRFIDDNGKSWTLKSAKTNYDAIQKDINEKLSKEEKAGRSTRAYKSYEKEKSTLDKLTESLKNDKKDLANKSGAEAREARARIKEKEQAIREQKSIVSEAEKSTGLSKTELKHIEEANRLEKEAKNNVNAATYSSLANATAALANIAQKLEPLYDEIAGYKSKIDTRLYGSNAEQFFGSYWGKISFDFSALIASPLVKQETLYKNVLMAVDKGIARDVEQMAMLETIKDKIATTFDTFDGTMLRLIRIQDSNTTAARLGMEASLTEMLNKMYETTEYLNSLSAQVRVDLGEAQALMGDRDAVDFEYQVQKWLGSMYSVGVSQSGINSISSALGKLAAGNIEGITNGGAGNLLIMAANNSNISIADILAKGLDASETNVLLNNVVGYMSTLVDEANGNLVVQQQLAKVFGLTASDLSAIKNIIREDRYNGVSMKSLYNTNETYESLLGTLGSRANSMYGRMSVGEMIINAMSNVEYSTAAGVASNPILYITNKVADILDSFAGGIPIPAVSVMGNSVDTKLTVSNIMKSAAMVTGFTQSLIAAIGSSIANGGSGFTGSGLLKLVGIDTSSVKRGSSTSSSGSGTVLNASVSDMSESATQEGKDSANQQQISAKEESSEITLNDVNNSVIAMKTILENVIGGNNAFHVIVDNTTPIKTEMVNSSSSLGGLLPSGLIS